MSAEQVWVTTEKGKMQIDPNLDVIGKVDSSMSALVLKANKPKKKTAYVEDVAALPQRTKQELVSYFFDSNGNRNKRQVAYLIRTDNQSKTVCKDKKAQKGKGVRK